MLLCIAAFSAVFYYMNARIAELVVENIQTLLTNYPEYEEGTLPENINTIQLRGAWLMFAGVVALAVGFGILLARFTLRPARETLSQQKIFISNVAHELRTPLSTIKTSTEVALLDEDLPASHRKTLYEIIGELDRASAIINNLLSLNTLTRPERMQFQNVDLGPLTDMVVRRHHALAKERNIEIATKKDDYRTVWGNPAGLEQVITNLLRNAIAYTPKNKSGAITISMHPDYHGAVVLSITDTGIGIEQKDLFRIFEPFYRAEASRNRAYKEVGSGLGLTIVNEIVRAHHGKIRIESAKGRGTTVSVFLPAGHNGAIEKADEQRSSRSEVSLDFSRGRRNDAS